MYVIRLIRTMVGFCNWSQLGPLGTAATNRPIVPVPGDYDNGEIVGIIDRRNRSTQRKLLVWIGLFLLLPLGAQGIRETLRFTSVS
jgi:hypothetical protein